MTRANIILAVEARLDELTPFTQVELNAAINLIDKLLDESTITILSTLPLHLLIPSEFSVTGLVEDGRIGHIPLPTDFLRLHSFQMRYWEQEVVKAISPEHPLYKLQKNEVTMGGNSKPVVVIKSSVTGKSLHYYSVETGDGHTPLVSLYIPRLVADTNDQTEFDKIIEFLSWQCASDVLLAMKNNGAETAKQKLAELISFKTY